MHDLFAGQDSCIKAAAVPPRTLAAPCAIRARGCGIPTCAGKWPLDAQYDLPLDPLSMSRPEFASARFRLDLQRQAHADCVPEKT